MAGISPGGSDSRGRWCKRGAWPCPSSHLTKAAGTVCGATSVCSRLPSAGHQLAATWTTASCQRKLAHEHALAYGCAHPSPGRSHARSRGNSACWSSIRAAAPRRTADARSPGLRFTEQVRRRAVKPHRLGGLTVVVAQHGELRADLVSFRGADRGVAGEGFLPVVPGLGRVAVGLAGAG